MQILTDIIDTSAKQYKKRRLVDTQEKFKEIDVLKLLDTRKEGDGEKRVHSFGIRRITYITGDEEGGAEAYEIKICINGKSDIRFYTLQQLVSRRFLPEFEIYVQNISKFYRSIREEILQIQFSEEYTSYETVRNGLQEVNGRWMYVFGNGSIDAEGFRPNIKSKMGGIYFPSDKVYGRQECIRDIHKMLQVYSENPAVFYPLFFINIMGITNGYFRKIGEGNFMRLSLWLDGTSGSGKTELAKAGSYAFSDAGFGRKKIVSVTGKRKEIFIMLLQASGSVGIVDDVKQEPVRERKNSVKNNVDDCVRSIFQGYLTDSVSGYPDCREIDCCAIITGEYLDNCRSLNARMLYIRTDGFLKNKKNAKALRSLQEQPKLLTGVCGGYIQFLLRKIEEGSFKELVKTKLKEIRKSAKMYVGIDNAERLQESWCMLKMAEWMTEGYFRDIGMGDDFVDNFHEKAEKSIDEVMDATYYLLEGGQMVLQKVMERVLMKAKIRKACYQEFFARRSKWKYHQGCFWINRDHDEFLWIDNYQKSMRKDCQENHYRDDDCPVLIIVKERLEELFQEEVQALLREKTEISSQIAESVIRQFWVMMREMGMIYQIPRNDSKLGRPAAEYPVFRRYTEYNGYIEKPIYMVEFENTVQINLEHPCMERLVVRIKNVVEEEAFEDADDWEIVDIQDKKLEQDEIYEIRRKFIRGKSLYKK